MPLFKNRDIAGDAPKYGINGVSTANGYSIYDNAVPVFTSPSSDGQNIRIIAVSDADAAANSLLPGVGWVLIREGTGGRAGRVSYELLVACGIRDLSIIPKTADTINTTIDTDELTVDMV
jgi:hypothetical protein